MREIDATTKGEVLDESWSLGREGMSKAIELYTAPGCEFSAAAREDLEWRGVEFVEYDIEQDPDARVRLRHLCGGTCTVPVLVEEGKPVQIGWMGRGCAV
ncbi:MAG TPA: glutaredoxin [Chloroflexota bacterium]